MQIKKIFVFLILLLATIALCILTNCSSSNADVQYIKTMGSGIIYDGYNDFPNNNIIANRNESGNYAFSAENLNQNGKKTANQKIEWNVKKNNSLPFSQAKWKYSGGSNTCYLTWDKQLNLTIGNYVCEFDLSIVKEQIYQSFTISVKVKITIVDFFAIEDTSDIKHNSTAEDENNQLIVNNAYGGNLSGKYSGTFSSSTLVEHQKLLWNVKRCEVNASIIPKEIRFIPIDNELTVVWDSVSGLQNKIFEFKIYGYLPNNPNLTTKIHTLILNFGSNNCYLQGNIDYDVDSYTDAIDVYLTNELTYTVINNGLTLNNPTWSANDTRISIVKKTDTTATISWQKNKFINNKIYPNFNEQIVEIKFVNNNITYVKKIRLKISNRIISDLYVKEKTRSISIPSNSVYDVSQHFNVNVYGVERYTKFYPLIWKMQVISGSANISIATNGFITTNSQKAIYRVDLVISMAYKGILAISIDNFKITVI